MNRKPDTTATMTMTTTPDTTHPLTAGNPAIATPMVSVRSLWFRYPAFDNAQSDAEMPWVLRDIAFDVAPGECLGIVGTTSSGKSTLCMALTGLVPQQTSGTIRGEVLIAGRDTKRVAVARLAGDVGIVFQDPEANLLGLTIEDEVAFGMENLGVPPAEMQARVDWALAAVGMSAPELRHRSAGQLSGGQKQRVGIAAVLAMQPRVLVLDEPTAELDPLGRQEVLGVVADLRRRQPDLAIVLVERDATAHLHLAQRLLVLDDGEIVASGTPQELFTPDPARSAALEARGIALPEMVHLAALLNADPATAPPQPYTFTTIAQAQDALHHTAEHRA